MRRSPLTLSELGLNADIFPLEALEEVTGGRLMPHHAQVLQRMQDPNSAHDVLSINHPQDLEHAAAYIALGGRVIHPFGNILALSGHPHTKSVEHTNRVKGRKPNRTGSVTATPENFERVFDTKHHSIPAELQGNILIDILYDLFRSIGPFGIRGPASKIISDNYPLLIQDDKGVFCTQLIAVGRNCPSHALLRRASEVRQKELNESSDICWVFFVTSANLSSNATGQEEPAHYFSWEAAKQMGSLQIPILGYGNSEIERETVVNHYSYLQPGSTTVLSLHNLAYSESGVPCLTIERYGSAHLDIIRQIVNRHGFDIVTTSLSQKRLLFRNYEEPDVRL